MTSDTSNQRLRLATIASACLVLCGSVIAFALEPITGRMAMPVHGASPEVWAACLVSFQGLLLLAYAYAHWVAPRIGAWHLAILLAAVLQWPLAWRGSGDPRHPFIALFGALLQSVALPFALSCTTVVVTQSWWSRASLPCRKPPWGLYGISNLGAFIALVGYPLCVEPWVGLAAQRAALSWAYPALLCLAATTFVALRPRSDDSVYAPRAAPPRHRALWMWLSAAPSALLVGVTNELTYEMGSMPLTWLVPLGLYLGSFAIAFMHSTRLDARLSRGWPWFGAFHLTALMFHGAGHPWLPDTGIVLSFFLLVVAAHRALYQLRPDVEQLTGYYLLIAVGGFVGGLAATLLPPLLLDDLYDAVAAAIFTIAGLWVAAQRGTRLGEWRPWPERPRPRMRLATGMFMLASAALISRGFPSPDVLLRHRDFHGIYRVVEHSSGGALPAHRSLVLADTRQGTELRTPSGPRPAAYHHPGSPMDDALATRPERARVALLGLGIGALAAALDANDEAVFYELDPDLVNIARRYFSFLGNASARVEIRIGDARPALADDVRQGKARFDIIVLDVFSGDAIPLHLLTREAWDIYLSALAPNGLLVFNVSNRYYDLRGVLEREAGARHLHAVELSTPPDRRTSPLDLRSDVVAVARNPARLVPLRARGWQAPDAGKAAGRRFSDDFMPLVRLLK